MQRTLPGRLPPASMFPAGRPDVAVRRVRLRSGLEVRAIEAGPAGGEPVVLVHGWACSVFTFHRTVGPLADAGFRVLAADLKGHGLSDKPLGAGEYTTPAMVAHFRDILDALGVTRTAIVGHSLGGALALDFAFASPERVSRLALLAPVGFGNTGIVRVLRALTPRVVSPLLPHLVSRWAAKLVLRFAYGRFRGFAERDVDEYWAPSQFPAATLAARAVAHEFTWAPSEPSQMATIRAPTLVVVGSRDRMIGPPSASRLFASRPGVQLLVVEGAGHVALEECPDAVNAALVGFLGAEKRASVRSASSG